MSNSTLRRKLFAGMIGDDETFDSEEEVEEDGSERNDIMEDDNHEQNKENINVKENCESTAMIVDWKSLPTQMLTPNSQRIPSPNKSVRSNSWCENFKIFLSPKIYVKSILENLTVWKFHDFSATQIVR